MASPDLAFAMILLGALGIYWELHAPGMIIPGFFGLLLVAAGTYEIYQGDPTWYGLALMLLAVSLLVVEAKFHTHSIAGLTGSILLATGALLLFPPPRRVSPNLAVACSAAFGLISIFLGYLGMRVAHSQPLTGQNCMIHEEGVARTELNPQGTVMVQGEYWQARSEEPISVGQAVVVQRVDGLLLQVSKKAS